MRYNLQDIWGQALQDDFATDINGQGYESRLVYVIESRGYTSTRSLGMAY